MNPRDSGQKGQRACSVPFVPCPDRDNAAPRPRHLTPGRPSATTPPERPQVTSVTPIPYREAKRALLDHSFRLVTLSCPCMGCEDDNLLATDSGVVVCTAGHAFQVDIREERPGRYLPSTAEVVTDA